MKIECCYYRAVWERTSFEIEVDDLDDLKDQFADQKIDEAMFQALKEGRVTIKDPIEIESMDDNWEFFDEDGDLIYEV